jgi:hypothetical protein
MSIAAMNWALRQRLASTQQQCLLYVIADSADPNGVTRHCDPEYMETHARMIRATLFRRLNELEELGLLRRLKFYSERGAPIYEIQLVLDALVDVPIRRRGRPGDDESSDENEGSEAATIGPESHSETLVQPTKVSPSASPKSQYCDSISPTLSEESPPYPPPGGVRSRGEVEQSEKRAALWERLRSDYPGIGTMDQQAAREELDALSIDDAEWAVSVIPELKAELRQLKDRAPKNAHLWLRKGMFRNFPRGKLEAPPPEGFWISEGSEQDRALRFVRNLARVPTPFVLQRGAERGYLSKAEVGPDLLAMLIFADQTPRGWQSRARGSPEFAAWQQRVTAWVGQGLPCQPGTELIRVPCHWPPKKDGTIYPDDPDDFEEPETSSSEDSAA